MEKIILKKASELFLKFGFKNVTMDEIANDLAISKKTIYVYYENKSELVEDVINYLFDEIIIIIKNIKALNLNAIDEYFKINEAVEQILKEEQLPVEYQLKKYFPEIYQRTNYIKSNLILESIADNLKRGIAEGYYRPRLDINFTGKYFLMVFSAIKNEFYDDLGEIKVAHAMKQFYELYFRSIVTEKGLEILEQHLKKEN